MEPAALREALNLPMTAPLADLAVAQTVLHARCMELGVESQPIKVQLQRIADERDHRAQEELAAGYEKLLKK